MCIEGLGSSLRYLAWGTSLSLYSNNHAPDCSHSSRKLYPCTLFCGIAMRHFHRKYRYEGNSARKRTRIVTRDGRGLLLQQVGRKPFIWEFRPIPNWSPQYNPDTPEKIGYDWRGEQRCLKEQVISAPSAPFSLFLSPRLSEFSS